MTFTLHPNLNTKAVITNLELCTVLLEDEKHYPWLILVPRRKMSLMDLEFDDQILLLKEINMATKALTMLCKPDNFNIASIGNKTPQLHVHVIGRYKTDPAWPHTVWDHPVRMLYSQNEKKLFIEQLQTILKGKNTHRNW